MDINIAGFRKTSLIDYPDNISTVLFTQGCNCKCPYCHNPGLVSFEEDKNYMDLEYFWDFVNERQHLLDGVVITGGEPTLQKDIVDFIKNIRNRSMKVKLDTNGSNFKVVEELLEEKLIDYIAMDIKAPFSKYNKVAGNQNIVPDVKKSINLILKSDINYEFRTTVVPGLHKKEDIKNIATSIKEADKYSIQNFRSDITLDSDLAETREFPESKLNKFKKLAGEYVKNVEIKN